MPEKSVFERLIEQLTAMGEEARIRTEDSNEYRAFIQRFPLESLPRLTLDDYCVGKGRKETFFCWWLEHGLKPVMGRYLPGTSRGHIIYFISDEILYKNRLLAELSDEDALRYTLKIQSAIASAKPEEGLAWVDDDQAIFRRAGVESRVTVGDGRKLRLLMVYHPDYMIPISSSDHLGHFLKMLGCPDSDIPPVRKPVARMEMLKEFYRRARDLVPGLSLYGFMEGLYSSELGIAPKKNQVTDDAAVLAESEATYLLTWNPAHFALEGEDALAVGKEVRWSCQSKQPRPGDEVYLVRLGVEPRGIVARGRVTASSFDAEHWGDPGKTANYIRFRVEALREECASGLLPMLLLESALPGPLWAPTGSGIVVRPDVAAGLGALWEAGAGKHSLRQFMEWCTGNIDRSPQGWLLRYQAMTARTRQLATGEQELTDEGIKELWVNGDNGVSGLRQGRVYPKDFERSPALLRQFTMDILAEPSAETYERINSEWEAAKVRGEFSRHCRAAIRRVFAAAVPGRYTTILEVWGCQLVLRELGSQFQLEIGNLKTGWCGLNAQIKRCFEQAGLGSMDALELNIGAWDLFELLKRRKKVDKTPVGPEEDDQDEEMEVETDIPLNKIFFGPPGTGKTYRTIHAAVEILEPDFLRKTEAELGADSKPCREALKDRFEKLKADGRVVFTTFHQSFSYEDFVEGIRAVSEDGQIEYRVEPGIFVRLCEKARSNPDSDSSFDKAFMELQKRLDEAGRLTLQTVTGKDFDIEYEGGETFRIFPASSVEQKAPYRAALRDVRRFFESGDKRFMHNPSYVHGILAYMQAHCGLPKEKPPALMPAERLNYVLIIDEINRGNISRVFGELITLIEPSKRVGQREALSVTLPYSRETFGVPDNVYLIGTMNTADRSLAGLDIALRRRFTFTEMPPDTNCLIGVEVSTEGVAIDVGLLLETMNQRIEVLLDRDHCLGHAYFLPLKDDGSFTRLAAIFRDQILPLLQEYFFEDWERIRWVLNDQNAPTGVPTFIRRTAAAENLQKLFGSAAQELGNPARWELNPEAFERVESFRNILGAV